LFLISLSGTAATPMISAGGSSSLFLNSDGSVWGTGRSTRYFPGATSPVRVFQLSGVIAVETCLNADFALLADGTLWGSGANESGQLADGTTQYRLEPQRIPGLSDVKALAAGATNHLLALKNDGTVWAWGRNDSGQLGDGTKTDRFAPVPVVGLTAITRILAGNSVSIALKSDGTVWVWGFTCCGGAGNGVYPSNPEDPENVHVIPTQVHNLDQVIAIAAGASHFMALRADGTVWTWGRDGSGQNGLGTFIGPALPVQIPGLDQVVAIEARGDDFSLALKADGTVWAWGNNVLGQLGVNGITYSTVPIQVPGVTEVAAISAGFRHVLALRRDGTVYAWGWNANGQLGDGTLQDRSTPRLVLGPGGSGQLNLLQPAPTNFNQLPQAEINLSASSGRAPLTVGASAINASDADGNVTAYYWKTGDGQQATGPAATFTFAEAGIISIDLLVEDNAGGRGAVSQTVMISPVLRAAVRATPKVLMGSDGSIALANDGRVLSWGKVQQIGLYDPVTWSSRTLVVANSIPIASDITGAVDIGGGYGQVFAVLADGTVLGWGDNADGQVGTANIGNGTNWQPLPLPNLPPVEALAAGGRHSLALTRDGRVFAWGSNYRGELGLGDNQNRFQPTKIAGSSDVVAIAAGYEFSAALRADGTVWAWGDNRNGQLGDETTVSRNSPVQVPGLTGIGRIFAIGYALFAQKTDGTMWATGYVPLDSPFDTPGPGARHIPSLDNVVQVAGGQKNNMIVLKSDGTVWTGGRRSSLALGFEGIGDQGVLKQLPGINDAIQVTSGSVGAMVLRRDGTVLAWGYNVWGQVGDGTLSTRQTPVLVVNETASGFLDLIPEVANTIPRDKIPPFFLATYSTGSLSSTTLYADLKGIAASGTFASAGDVGRFATGYNVYVAANVPTSAAAPYLQLDSGYNWSLLTWPMAEFLRGVALDSQDAVVRAQILQNMDLSSPELAGASLIVGYGTDPDEMVRNARYRTIFTVSQP
jgi:alpha-tubulin suppressor-like RCC1 family protein